MNLNEDDKKLLLEQFDRLRAGLSGITANLEQLAGNQERSGANQERLQTAVERLAAAPEQNGIILAQIDAKFERAESNLLTEFQAWSTRYEARLRSHTLALRAIDLEMESLSERVKKLEDPGLTH